MLLKMSMLETGGLADFRLGVIAPIIHEHKPDKLSAMIQKESAEISEVQGYEHEFYWTGYSDYLSLKEQERLF